MTSRSQKQPLAYLGCRMETGLPLGVRCLEPTAAAKLGPVVKLFISQSGTQTQMSLEGASLTPDIFTAPGGIRHYGLLTDQGCSRATDPDMDSPWQQPQTG
ncbi:olfactory receptor [Cricetulus griseus]|uniref:Olfactory receptor n=1 Tax=Cricetulus griseus TaxID=10029 RepID=A0A061IM25_CRIGR|nr:olfactory receptor [Cricetulus griseus]